MVSLSFSSLIVSSYEGDFTTLPQMRELPLLLVLLDGDLLWLLLSAMSWWWKFAYVSQITTWCRSFVCCSMVHAALSCLSYCSDVNKEVNRLANDHFTCCIINLEIFWLQAYVAVHVLSCKECIILLIFLQIRFEDNFWYHYISLSRLVPAFAVTNFSWSIGCDKNERCNILKGDRKWE